MSRNCIKSISFIFVEKISDEVHMYPLIFAEFMTSYSGDKYMGLSEYMLYGGIPLVVLREGANDKATALQKKNIPYLTLKLIPFSSSKSPSFFVYQII